LKRLATKITPDGRPGDYAQAVMDLGATICTPRNPQCLSCPVNACCLSLKRGKTTLIPKKKVKQRKPVRYGMAFLCINDKKEVLLRRRPNSGLFSGMMEIPGTPWTDCLPDSLQIEASKPTIATWSDIQGTVFHFFTHFKLEIKVVRADIKKSIKSNGLSWHPLESIDKAGLPSLMLKIIKHGLQ
jgi:A/G-specific adenine glycosylase